MLKFCLFIFAMLVGFTFVNAQPLVKVSGTVLDGNAKPLMAKALSGSEVEGAGTQAGGGS